MCKDWQHFNRMIASLIDSATVGVALTLARFRGTLGHARRLDKLSFLVELELQAALHNNTLLQGLSGP